MLVMQHEAIRDAKRIVRETGNVGRKVDRLLARLFNVGRFYTIFTVRARDVLDAALFQSCVHEAVYRAGRHPAASGFTLTVKANQSPFMVHVGLTPVAIPSGLRARRALIEDFLTLVQPIMAVAECASNREELDIRRQLYLGHLPADDAAREIRELGELARGNFANLHLADAHQLKLAVILNPAVQAAVDLSNAEAREQALAA